jgi:hypothetical protein
MRLDAFSCARSHRQRGASNAMEARESDAAVPCFVIFAA